MNRYIIEIGMGVDLHGQDINKAAKKAIRNAIEHSCLCGLDEVLHLSNKKERIQIEITLACSSPEQIRCDEMLEIVPIGTPRVKVVHGGMKISGLYAPEFGDKNESIEVVIASMEVGII